MVTLDLPLTMSPSEDRQLRVGRGDSRMQLGGQVSMVGVECCPERGVRPAKRGAK